MTIAANKLSQSNDIAGSRNQSSSLDVTEESSLFGAPIQDGYSASISGTAPTMIISGLSGMTSASTCNFLTISGADSVGNNGTFQITEVLSSTSVTVTNASGVAFDANNGSIVWVERGSYSLEDDLNYARSDRANIKGVDYDESIPTYTRCTDQSSQIPANLANIAGNTTDAKAFVDNLRYHAISVSTSDAFITLSDAGNLKHADSVDITGVPVNDGYDISNDEATFVAILDSDGYEVTVLANQGLALEGWRVIGFTRAGSSTSPDSVEVEFKAVAPGEELSTAEDYTWEDGQPSLIDVIIGYRTCLNDLSEAAFRKLLIYGTIYGGQGGSGGGTNLPLPTEYGQLLYSVDGTEFTSAIPVVEESEGLIMIDVNGRIVVVGGT